MNESIVMSHICDDIIDNDYFFSSRLFDSFEEQTRKLKGVFFLSVSALKSSDSVQIFLYVPVQTCTDLFVLIRTSSYVLIQTCPSSYEFVRPVRPDLYVPFHTWINLYVHVKTSVLDRVSKFRANKHSTTKKYETKA